MLRTVTTALHEGRSVAAISRLPAHKLLHISRRCLSERCSIASTANQIQQPVEGSSPEDAKKPRKKKAAASKKAKNITKSLLHDSKLRTQLDEYERLGQTITVDDVERYRPAGRVPDSGCRNYAEKYREMAKPLERSFTKEQLFNILKLYNITEPAGPATKRNYASLIMEKWGWSLPDGPGGKTFLESFPLKPREAFLLMHDSAKYMKWSRNRAVKLSFTHNPLSLNAKGPLPLVNEIGAYVKALREDIRTANFQIPVDTTLSSSALKSLSKSCGTFIETLPDSQLSISYLQSYPTPLGKTQRAITNTAYLNKVSATPPLFYHQVQDALSIVEPPQYSLLPFTPVQTHWLTRGSTSTYRIQCINGPVAGVDQIVPISSDSLAALNTLDTLNPKFDIHQWLHDMMPSPASKVTVKVSPGHVLMEPIDPQTFIAPSPLSGQLALDSMIDWVRQTPNYRHTFHPCVPKSVYGFQTTTSSVLQRLEYSAVSPLPSELQRHAPTQTSILRCHIGLHLPGEAISFTEPNSTESTQLLLPIPDSLREQRLQVRCEVGWHSEMDVMVPDCSTDLRFSTSALKPLSPDTYPIDLKIYALQARDGFQFAEAYDNAKMQPNPPLSVFYDGQLYVLTAFNHVRENRKQSRNETGTAIPPFELVTETFTDVENPLSHGHSTCQIYCGPPFSGVQWDRFMRHCEWLTRGVAHLSVAPLFEEEIVGGL